MEEAPWEESARLGRLRHDGLRPRTEAWGLEIEQNALRNLAQLAVVRGDLARARERREQSLAVAHRRGSARRAAFDLLALGGLARRMGDPSAATTAYTDLLRLAGELDDRWLWERAAAGLAAGGGAATDSPPPAGRTTGGLVDLGGRRLYVRRDGPAVPRPPSVVFESGLGDSWSGWEAVLAHVAGFAPAIAYSRAGLPPSDPGPLPRTSNRIASDLRALLGVLAGEGLAPPYVLVGHSFGALSVRLFAARYPSDVVGLVLLDGAHEDSLAEVRRHQVERPREEWAAQDRWYRGGNPSEHADVTASMEQLEMEAVPLPATLPVTVVASRWTGANYHPDQPRPGQRPKDVGAAAAAAARYGPAIRFVLAEASGHYIHADQPDLVADLVRAAVDAWRREPRA
jgi:pimeloyl-ACP methyl ester carboxylesterase